MTELNTVYAHGVRHHIVVPAAAGMAPWCTCGWPETEGGVKYRWRPGEPLACDHLQEVIRSDPEALDAWLKEK